VEQILERKNAERTANDGLFLWGIGNSVANGIRELVRLEREPFVVFSPMRAKPRPSDVRPSAVFAWEGAIGLDGHAWCIPSGSTVLSRATAGQNGSKRSHYALVCRSHDPLCVSGSKQCICFGELSNLVSGAPLGFSQVTSVVDRANTASAPQQAPGALYEVGFVAHLVFPYFVQLTDPAPIIDGRIQRKDKLLRQATAQLTSFFDQ